ncbi:UNKNOWN [Stylonychia lemnae]|uniref:Uncharacterized protein n=1 Tax=Stylonychia lemnae TaxID=5949 RepID=A0A078AJB2_STYLE|nr:UNKNOWN [Stylonychia lemnae]|eukprot:CDW81587.1 UNKNOWN [Stylonychia lemnae]
MQTNDSVSSNDDSPQRYRMQRKPRLATLQAPSTHLSPPRLESSTNYSLNFSKKYNNNQQRHSFKSNFRNELSIDEEYIQIQSNDKTSYSKFARNKRLINQTVDETMNNSDYNMESKKSLDVSIMNVPQFSRNNRYALPSIANA